MTSRAADDSALRDPVWPEDRDAAVMLSAGNYATLTQLTEKWDIPIATVQARWHRLGAA